MTMSTQSNFSPPIPESVMTADRVEHDRLPLNLVWGELPADLQGHVFITAPVGSVNSGGIPFPDGTSIINGGGMVYRLDFDTPGEVRATTKLVKPPCYYADKGTTKPEYAKYKFNNSGLARFSLSLGLRNELNTAMLPMRFAGEDRDRLLVCWDGGRPFEIDTQTLEVATAVGSNEEWQPQAETPLNFVFKPVMSSAHPYFDPHAQNENSQSQPVAFTVNYGKSLAKTLQNIPFLSKVIGSFLDGFLNLFAEFLKKDSARDGFFSWFFQWLWQIFLIPISWLAGIFLKMTNFTYLIRWDGRGELERWKVVCKNGSRTRPVAIEQTMHQIQVTQNYVILMDTAFQFGIGQIINNPFPNSPGLSRLLRVLITSPQMPKTVLYIIKRADLQNGKRPARGGKEVEAIAQKVEIPREAIHFLADYEDSGSEIVLHIGHVCAWEGSEWVRTYDRFANDPAEPVPDRVRGAVSEEMDISYVGRYTIRGETGEIVQQDVIKDFTCTWGISFFAYRPDPSTGMMPAKLDNIYWTSMGLWNDNLTEFLFELTKNYPYRTVDPQDLLLYGDEGVPPCLFRVSTGDYPIAIGDRYQFPEGYMVNSIQFVPSGSDPESSTKGYIVCTVFYPENNEVWIFNGEDLASGPLCKLSHPSLNFGFTTHTAWLPKIAPRTASYRVDVREDYQPLVEKKRNPEIQKLFDEEVYPHFEEGR